MKPRRPVWLLYALMLALTLASIEVALQAVAVVSRQARWMLSPSGEIAVADDRLEFRPNPAFPEHDERGFRNDRVPASVDAVALGDSQTYGVGVRPRDAWPARLRGMTGREVYSMAFSGYGPGHSVLLWPEAMTLRPALVIEAFYSGNDLYDAYHLVRDRGQLKELAAVGPEAGERIREAEAAEPLETKINRLSPAGPGPRPARNAALEFVARHCKTYGLLRLVKRAVLERSGRGSIPNDAGEWQQILARARQANPPVGWDVFDNGRFRTVFRPDYRMTALDRTDPRIAEGYAICQASILEMNRRAQTNATRFLALLIPTKELVFANENTNATPAFRKLVAAEQMMWELARAILRSNRVEYLEVLPALRAELAKGVQPYPVTDDGHPNPAGQAAIAAAVASWWTGNGAARHE